MRMRILNLKRHLSKNSREEYRQIQEEEIDRNENYCIEHEGMVQGLERATELVEQAIGKQENHTTPPGQAPSRSVKLTGFVRWGFTSFLIGTSRFRDWGNGLGRGGRVSRVR